MLFTEICPFYDESSTSLDNISCEMSETLNVSLRESHSTHFVECIEHPLASSNMDETCFVYDLLYLFALPCGIYIDSYEVQVRQTRTVELMCLFEIFLRLGRN